MDLGSNAIQKMLYFEKYLFATNITNKFILAYIDTSEKNVLRLKAVNIGIYVKITEFLIYFVVLNAKLRLIFCCKLIGLMVLASKVEIFYPNPVY